MVSVVEFTSISVAFLRINDTIQIKIPHSISNNQMQNEGESTSFSLVQSSRFWMGCAAMEGRRMIMQPILLLSCKKYLSTHGYMADWWLLHTRTEVLRSTTANLLWQFLSSLAIRRASSRQVYTKYVRSKRRGRPGGLFLSQSIPKHCFQLSVY